MVKSCCINTCQLNEKTQKMYRIPIANREMFLKWVDAIGRSDFLEMDMKKVYMTYRVCCFHFSDDQKLPFNHNRTNLKVGSIPDINLPVSIEWTVKEKKLLLQALEKHGPKDVFAIAEEIPFKSVSDVKEAIQKYVALAMHSIKEETDVTQDAPLDKWIKVVKNASPATEHINPVAKALKYIALFETRKDTDINITDCYRALEDLVSGIQPKELNEPTDHFLNDCLTQLAQSVKREDNDKAKRFLKNINLDELNKPRTYNKKGKNTKRDICNPLNVPIELLGRKNNELCDNDNGNEEAQELEDEELKEMLSNEDLIEIDSDTDEA